MAVWPVSLPQDQFLESTEQKVDHRLRSTMDAGPPKMRRRFTAAITNYDCPIVLNGAQKIIFDAFLEDTLVGGTLPFDWEDLTTDTVASYRFRELPQWQIKVGGTVNTRLYTTTLALEKLP